jgi:hypothetical protein
MSIPVIDTTQSVLGYLQHEHWEYQPYATNAPTSWTSTPLPYGISIDPASGLISGRAIYPGVYVFGLTATNASGPSATVVFTMGI